MNQISQVLENKRLCRQTIVMASLWLICCFSAMSAGLLSWIVFLGAASGLVTACVIWYNAMGGKLYLWRLSNRTHLVEILTDSLADILEIELISMTKLPAHCYVKYPLRMNPDIASPKTLSVVYEFKHAKHAMALKMKWGNM